MFFSPIGNSNPFLPNLVAYYKFDTNSNDFSGNSHNGVDTAISYANAGKVGNCATFNGSTSFISVPQSTDFDFSDAISDIPFSVLTGGYFSGTSNTIVGKNNNTPYNGQWNIYNLSGKIYVVLWKDPVGGDRIGRVSSVTLSLNTQYHICVTYTGSGTSSGIKIYINGIEDLFTTDFSAGTYTKMQIINEPLIIGKLQASGAFYLNGRLDEMYIYKNRQLISSDIFNASNKFFAGNPLI